MILGSRETCGMRGKSWKIHGIPDVVPVVFDGEKKILSNVKMDFHPCIYLHIIYIYIYLFIYMHYVYIYMIIYDFLIETTKKREDVIATFS